jgi:hypothetical protein
MIFVQENSCAFFKIMETTAQLLVVAILCILAYWFYKSGTKNGDYFIKKGLNFWKPVFFFGNNFEFFVGKINVFDYLQKSYTQFPGQK